MLADTTLHKRAGWSLMLFGLLWLISSISGNWSKCQFETDLLWLIAGVGLIVVGFRIKKRRVESAKSGIGCMWAVLILLGVEIPLYLLAYFGITGDGPKFTAEWHGRPLSRNEILVGIAIMIVVAAWAAANLAMLKEWVRRSREPRASKANGPEAPPDPRQR